MPKAVILYSFKKGDTSPFVDNLTKLSFNRKDGRRTILSKEFSVNEVELNVSQLKKIKTFIAKNATVLIASPFRVWREAFKAAGVDSEEATMLAGLATASSPVTTVAPPEAVEMETEMDAEAAPIKAELKAEESQAEGIVEDDFDVDALVSSLSNAKLGGRRRKTRSNKKLRRRYSRRAPSLG